MAIGKSRFTSGLVLAALLATSATPAMARGWGGGWGGRHHDHDDTGWIVGGIIGIGMIAAVAAAASNSKKKKEQEARERDYRYRDYDYRDDRDYRDGRDYRDDGPRYGERREDGNYGYRQGYSSRGIDGAVDNCVNEVERGSTRVDSIDTVGRDGDGWRVDGRISGGKPFSCSVSGSGRIRAMTIDGRTAMVDDATEAQPGG